MPKPASAIARVFARVFDFLAVLLICKVTLSVVIGYRQYLPPDFQSDFLQGREAYFWGAYAWAFYAHLIVGPAALLVGTLLISDRFRAWAPKWHRRLGRVQGIGVLCLLAPSGLWMAWNAQTGAVAGAGLGTLAVATAVCTALGWKAAVQRRFEDHRRWMGRTYMLLISAVMIRIIGGLATVTGYSELWLYPFSAWASWLVPLLVFEFKALTFKALTSGQGARPLDLPASITPTTGRGFDESTPQRVIAAPR
jgi:hypothetical protein